MKIRTGFLVISMIALSGLALMLTACGGGGSASGSSGLTLRITDAPVSDEDIAEVWVTFTKVIIQPVDGERFEVDVTDDDGITGKSIDIKNLTEGKSMLLGEYALPEGDYSWMRLVIDPAETYVVETEGGTPLLDCSSCDESHLKLNRSFTIETEGWVDFTIDFDLRKSITLTQPQSVQPRLDYAYKLRPTLRIIDTDVASSFIYGAVSDTRIVRADSDDPTGCAVYVYEGAQDLVEPDDICEIEDSAICPEADRPLLEAGVEFNESSGLYEYRTGFMNPGTYTVALLCAPDDPVLDDVVSFIGEIQVITEAGSEGTGSVDFSLEDVVVPQAAP